MAKSILAFSVIKYLGAAYLVYLGIKTIRSRVALALVDQKIVEAPHAVMCLVWLSAFSYLVSMFGEQCESSECYPESFWRGVYDVGA